MALRHQIPFVGLLSQTNAFCFPYFANDFLGNFMNKNSERGEKTILATLENFSCWKLTSGKVSTMALMCEFPYL